MQRKNKEDSMSNIITTPKDVETLHSHLEYIRSNGINLTSIVNFLEEFILKDENGNPLSPFVVDSKKCYTAHYERFNNILNISYDGFMEKVAQLFKKFLSLDKNLNISDDFKNYVALFILLHELEHSCQYYISYDLLNSPCIMVKNCYQLLCIPDNEMGKRSFTEVLKNKLGDILYKITKGFLALERNANVESLNAIYQLASLEQDEGLIKLINMLRMSQALIGYEFGGQGVLINTAKVLFQLDKLEGFDEIDTFSFEEKVRYGFPLTKEELQQLLSMVVHEPEKNKRVKFVYRI